MIKFQMRPSMSSRYQNWGRDSVDVWRRNYEYIEGWALDRSKIGREILRGVETEIRIISYHMRYINFRFNE